MKLIDGDRLAQVWPLEMTPLQRCGELLTAAIRAEAPFSHGISPHHASILPPPLQLFLFYFFSDFPPLAIICPFVV